MLSILSAAGGGVVAVGVATLAGTTVSTNAGSIGVGDVASSVRDIATVCISSLTSRDVAVTRGVTAPGSSTSTANGYKKE